MRWIKAVVIFLLTLAAIAGFAPGDAGNPGQVTRFGLAYSMSEGRLDIDNFRQLTVDIARFEGRYYADKPPGLSLLATPAVWVGRAVMNIPPGTWPLTREQTWALTKIAIVSSVGLLAALAAAILYLLARRLGASDNAALFAACTLALGTPFLNWSTTIFPHAATGSLLLMALALILWARGRTSWWIAPLLGLILGYSITIDFTAAPAVALLGLYCLFRERGRFWQRAIGAALGGLIGLLPLFIYNWMVFHSPFKLGYSEVVGFAGMKVGLFGLTVPDPAVIVEILFGLRRGMLPLAPVLLLLPLGWWAMWKRPDLRGVLCITLGIAACFILVNASYYYWDGGSSTGPRHIVAILPVLAIALSFAWPQGWLARAIALLLLAVSLGISAAVPGIEQFAPAQMPFPLWDPILTGLMKGAGWDGLVRMLLPWFGFAVLPFLRDRSAEGRAPQS
jgi:hypothetical protein